MSLFKFNPRTTVLLLFIFAIALVRVILNFNYEISPLANFSCVGAMALFGGAYFDKQWKGFAFPILTLFISDFILNQTVFKSYGNGFLYSGWYWVYGAFAIMTIDGKIILKKVTATNFIISVIVCVLIHWVVSDIGVWIGSTLYAQNASGFAECLTAAIPFEWRFLAGTLIYGIILFGSFELMKRKYFFLVRA